MIDVIAEVAQSGRGLGGAMLAVGIPIGGTLIGGWAAHRTIRGERGSGQVGSEKHAFSSSPMEGAQGHARPSPAPCPGQCHSHN